MPSLIVFLSSGTGYGVDVAEISARWDAVAGDQGDVARIKMGDNLSIMRVIFVQGAGSDISVKNNWPPAALPEIPDEKEETGTCAPHREAGIRVGWYSAKLTILPREEMGPPADDGCDVGALRKRNFTKVHVDPQLLSNSQTCPKAFNEVVELSVGVSSPLASNTHTSLCLGLSTR
ncbi:hypothetical protein G5I_12410 [Acromyrmex echinatior]|uniref:Uncharacterized protein n=1 Tax=Acromyrmex echinatior TaxID=103372 RepID=F4X288_ACREC|nr:hypothetical protein G5I_12410 [Acromyrmex echinatior]